MRDIMGCWRDNDRHHGVLKRQWQTSWGVEETMTDIMGRWRDNDRHHGGVEETMADKHTVKVDGDVNDNEFGSFV